PVPPPPPSPPGPPSGPPPLYYLLAHAWLALGDDEAVLRTLSALLGALAVPLLGLLGAALFERRVGLLAAALLAGAPAHVFYSRDARMYPLLTLLLLLATYALVRATGERGAAAALGAAGDEFPPYGRTVSAAGGEFP